LKRTPEFVLGLIGGILGMLTCAFIFNSFMSEPETIDNNGPIFIVIILFVLQLTALILSCLVNNLNNYVYAGIMLFIGVVSIFLSIFILTIPGILYLISGGMAFRKFKSNTPINEEKPFH
jgi:predicted tellurium resistance membrane protein TerC